MQPAFAPDPLRPGARRPRPAGAPATARRPLTVREDRFVQEYLVDLNARAAARRAGYRWPSGTPGKLLQRPEVRGAIKSAMDEHAERLAVTRDRVVRELAVVAFSSIADLADWGLRDGEPYLDVTPLDQLPAEVVGAVSQVVHSRRGLRVTLHDKVPALMALARHLGLLCDWGNRLEGAAPADDEPKAAEAFDVFSMAAMEALPQDLRERMTALAAEAEAWLRANGGRGATGAAGCRPPPSAPAPS